jgi:hypothetical protein
MNRLLTAIALAPLALGGCHVSTVEIGQLDQVLDMPAIPNRNVDILFVIDNSPSMLDKQASLVASFPKMMDALGTLEGGLPNLHIGVATSDMGTMGSLDSAPGPGIGSGPGACSGRGDDGALQNLDGTVPAAELGGALYISDLGNGDGSRTRNYTGELRDVFTKIASVGANGCGMEQPLASMRRALGNPANGDFVRPGANLAVVILADEDDCSVAHSTLFGADTSSLGPLTSFRCTRFGVECDDGGATTDAMNQVGAKANCHARAGSPYVEDVTPFADYLIDLKGHPRAVMVSAIAGPVTPVTTELRVPPGGGAAVPGLAHSCQYFGNDGPEVADPAVRISELVDAFPGRGTFSTVCDGDLSFSLASVGYATKKLVGDPCIDSELADTSDAPGIQPLCEVTDNDETTPPCDGTNAEHCWQILDDPQTCGETAEHLRLDLQRTAAPAEGSYVTVRCLRRS